MVKASIDMLSCLVVLILIPATYLSNILVIGGVLGSHLYTSADVAKTLNGFGHNVTLLSVLDDPRMNYKESEEFHYVSVTHNDTLSSEQLNAVQSSAEEAISAPSQDMMVEMIKQSGSTKDNFDMFNQIALPYFGGPKFSRLLEEGKFKLVVIEDTLGYASALSLVHKDIPIIGIMSISDVCGSRSREGFPLLLNSEPNLVNEIVDDRLPTLSDRWATLLRNLRLLNSILQLFHEVYSDDMTQTGKELTDYLIGFYDIIFVKDHPAFSFPYLSPPNTFYLGASHLVDYPIDPLPDVYLQFFENCPYDHVVFMSFGTYLEDLRKFPKINEVLRSLNNMPLCVVLKSGLNLSGQLSISSKKILEEAWVPQKSLLHSGKINFFISHCGNNGRIESIFYNVPLLCIPLFGDQYYNARLVARNEFGLYLTKERLDTITFTQAVENMIQNNTKHKISLAKAMDIAKNDPGAGIKVLKFYTDLLIENGSANFLRNKIIVKQWYYEIMNLDIVVLGLLAFTFIATIAILFLYKCSRHMFRKITKPKSE